MSFSGILNVFSIYRVKKLREKSSDQHAGVRKAEEGNFRASMVSLLCNKPYLFNQLAAASDTWIITGMGAFLPKVGDFLIFKFKVQTIVNNLWLARSSKRSFALVQKWRH